MVASLLDFDLHVPDVPPSDADPRTMTPTRLARRQFVDFQADGSRLPHMPGLDGIRGIAVIGVVLFHTDLGVMKGGFLGVSTFFTLSGFLITSLLLGETMHTGAVDLRGFWGRRYRRLLPASVAALFAVSTLFAWVFATRNQLDSLREQVWASLGQVANWQLILSGSSYGDLFAAPSPVLHFWSLAIEEQFYVVFPVLLVGLWSITRKRTVLLGWVLAGLAAVSALLPVVFTMSRDRVYFGTDTRAAEVLLGAVLAVVIHHRGLRSALARPTAARGALTVAATVLAAIQLYWWITLEQSSSFLYSGGLALYASMTCVIVLAASLPGGPVRNAMVNRPLAWFGARSYGIYLIHWPVFLAVRQTWTTAPTWVLAVLGVTISLLLAEVSYRVIEQPVKLRRTWIEPRFARLALASIALVAVVAAFLPTDTADPDGGLDFDAAEQDTQQLLEDAAEARAEAPTTTAAPAQAPTPTLAMFGDSTGMLMALGMLQYAAESGRIVGLEGDVALGCGVSRFDSRRVDTEFGYSEDCKVWEERWSRVIAEDPPNIAQLVTGSWEITDAKLPGTSTFSSIGDPTVDDFIRSEITTAVDVLSSQGAMVLLVLWPRSSDFLMAEASPGERAKLDPARMERLHEIMREIAATRPDSVRVLDLEQMLVDRLDDPELRPDGVHIPAEQVNLLYQQGLADATLEIWQEYWQSQVERISGDVDG